MNFKKLATISILALVSSLALANSVSAFPFDVLLPGHRRITYTKSDITRGDMVDACINYYGNQVSDVSRNND